VQELIDEGLPVLQPYLGIDVFNFQARGLQVLLVASNVIAGGGTVTFQAISVTQALAKERMAWKRPAAVAEKRSF
jgi:hypothetical protein